MSYVITAENFLVNFLAYTSRSCVTFKSLRCAKEVISKDINIDIYIDITAESILSLAVERQKFRIGKKSIKLSPEFQKKINECYINDNYNWILPKDIKLNYLKAVSDVAKQEI